MVFEHVIDLIIDLELEDVSVDGCITQAPCGGNKAGSNEPAPTTEGTTAPPSDASSDPYCRTLLPAAHR